MLERRPIPEATEARQTRRLEQRRVSPEYDLSTILTIPISEVEVGQDVETMARDYLDTLRKEAATEPQLSEIAWAFRRQLQRDLYNHCRRQKIDV